MNQGICTNLPRSCEKARSGERMDMPTGETRCSECDYKLQQIAAKPDSGITRHWKVASLGLASAAALAAGIYMGSSAFGPDKRPAITPPPAHKPQPDRQPAPPQIAPAVPTPPSERLVEAGPSTGQPCLLSARWPGSRTELCEIRSASRPLTVNLLFRANSAEFEGQTSAELIEILERFRAAPDARLLVAGFAGEAGTYDEQCRLSEKRATTVRKALHALGVTNVASKGFCGELTDRDGDVSSGTDRNRRAELFLFTS